MNVIILSGKVFVSDKKRLFLDKTITVRPKVDMLNVRNKSG
jgi:hypothetical protein